jgi:hypothetical protein
VKIPATRQHVKLDGNNFWLTPIDTETGRIVAVVTSKYIVIVDELLTTLADSLLGADGLSRRRHGRLRGRRRRLAG